MVVNGFKRKNVPSEHLKAMKQSKKVAKTLVHKPEGLDWSYLFSNNQLKEITKTTDIIIIIFINHKHLRYITHITRLDNTSFQKQRQG